MDLRKLKKPNNMKFQLNLTQKTLRYWDRESTHLLDEDHQFTTYYGGLGFVLDLNNPAHWINFTLSQTKVIAFYKQPKGTVFFYYRKEVPRSELVEVEFTETDQVIKVENKWVKVYD